MHMSKWIKDYNSQNPPKGSRGDRRWTLVFIGGRSKTIAFNHLKAAVIITALIILALAGISFGLGYLYREALVDIRSLKEKLENVNQSVISLRDEKDVLMAKLVMAESRVGGTLASNDKKRPDLSSEKPLSEISTNTAPELSSASRSSEEDPASPEAGNDSAVYHKVETGDSLYLISMSYGVSVNLLRQYNDMKESSMIHPGQMLVIKPGTGSETVAAARAAPAPKPAAPKAEPKPEPKPVAQESERKMNVDAEKMNTVIDPSAKLLRVEYVLRNKGDKTQPINGYTVVILKNEDKDPDRWLVLPAVPLESGIPKGSEGYSFSIYNYRTIRFKISDPVDTERFTQAVVYVFTPAGDLVLVKQFAVSVKGAENSSST
jgi:LysM repeat protein